jgi:hypothetical protein
MASSNEITEKAPFEATADSSDNDHEIRGEVVPVEHVHLTVGDMLKGTGVHESTPFERKASLVNA